MKHFKYFGLIAIFTFISCKKPEFEAPAGYVHITVSLNSMVYDNLRYIGGTYLFEYNDDGFPAGKNGVMVYRDVNWFNAFECSCPLDSCMLNYDRENDPFILECECCESWFSVATGSCLQGDAEGKFLRAYKTYVEGSTLYVRNN